MAITRRQFIKRTGLATAGTVLGPGLFGNMFVRHALAFSGKYFIVLFLDGGNDGLNTVVPYSGTMRTAYDGNIPANALRKTGAGGLNIAKSVIDTAGTKLTNAAFANGGKDPNPNTGSELALHPGFAANPGGLPSGGLKYIYDQGKVAVIQGCGYPEYSLSHEESRNIWESANPLSDSLYTGSGWMGRYLVGNADSSPPPYSALNIPAVNIADSVVGEYRNTGTSVLALRRLADFGFPYDNDYPGDNNAKEIAFEALYGAAAGSGNPTVSYIGNTGTSTETASQQYPQAHDVYHADRGSTEEMYNDDNGDGSPALNTSTARGIREIAKIIYANERNLVAGVDANFFQLSNGGYDTHSNQGAGETNGQHYSLHAEVGNAIRLFWQDLATMGAGNTNIQNKVCILVWSEFSRRILQNDNGTDHGSQGPMFVIGGTVNGGVYGNHPNINSLDSEGNTQYRQDSNGGFRSTDFRDVYGTILKHWLGMSNSLELAAVLPIDPSPFNPNFYWRTANFDLGFLP